MRAGLEGAQIARECPMLRLFAVTVVLALSLPAVAAAETVDLGAGRSMAFPESFAGCTANPIQAAANGARSFLFNCTLTVEGKPAKVTMGLTHLPPSNTSPQAFIQTVMQKMNRSAMIGDPTMGIQRKTLKTSGRPASFQCWVYDDVPSLSGGAVCALDEPSTRFTIFVSTSDAYTAMRVVEQTIAMTSLR